MQTDAETQGATEGSGLADSGIFVSVIMQVDNFTGRKMRACLRISDAAGSERPDCAAASRALDCHKELF